jgi:peptidoglycan lytic transglycosylase
MNMSPRILLWKGHLLLAAAFVSFGLSPCLISVGGLTQAYASEAASIPRDEVGLASWYGNPYHGRKAANGEIYDMRRLTAAHRTLPFGTRVRVHNLENDRVVDVLITDRGPFVEGRLIDLSRAAARMIGMQRAGTARVRLELLSAPAEAPAGSFAVQVGAFRIRANAERLRAEMERRFGYAIIVPRQSDPVLWRVVAGRYRNQEDARTIALHIRSEESDRLGPAFVQRLDD